MQPGFGTPIAHRFGLIASLALLQACGGCQQSPPGEFQTFQQKQESGYVPAESFPTEIPLDPEEPLTAELVADETDDELPLELPVSALAPVNVVDGSNVADILQVARSTSVAGEGSGAASEKPAAGPRQVELLIKEKEFRPEGPQAALRVNYDDLDLLKILNMEPVPADAVDHFPDWLKHLDGKRIRIRGFMMPTFESTGLERFVLARDTGLCCFGRNPKVYDLISVELKPDKPSDYIHLRAFDVLGTLKIEMVAEGGKPLGLYWIEDAEVIQK